MLGLNDDTVHTLRTIVLTAPSRSISWSCQFKILVGLPTLDFPCGVIDFFLFFCSRCPPLGHAERNSPLRDKASGCGTHTFLSLFSSSSFFLLSFLLLLSTFSLLTPSDQRCEGGPAPSPEFSAIMQCGRLCESRAGRRLGPSMSRSGAMDNLDVSLCSPPLSDGFPPSPPPASGDLDKNTPP